MTGIEFLIDGSSVRVGKRVGKGGEGEVFALDSNRALKVYSRPDPSRQAKIEAMIRAGLAGRSELIAFPIAIARSRQGAFAGFTMRLVSGHQPLFELYAPGARKQAFPKADYRFIVRAAANIARAVAKVHESGAVIGDINHSGILISDKAMAALIDADSFQYGSYRCVVGVPEYTPPELQGRRLSDVERTPVHDAFGLAVVLFQLLFMGRHPFAGRYSHGEMPIERAIAEHRFAYSMARSTEMEAPPGACGLSDFPPDIVSAFESAFGVQPSGRPSAADWVSLVHALEGRLIRCGANADHFYANAASSCPWCRMEQTVGMVLFLPASLAATIAPAADPGERGFDLVAVWAAIQRINEPSVEDAVPNLPSFTTPPTEAAKARKREGHLRLVMGWSAVAAAAALLIVAHLLWFAYLPLALWGGSKLLGAHPALSDFANSYSRAEQMYHSAVVDWRRRVGAGELSKLRHRLEQAKSRYETLPAEFRAKAAELDRKRRETQLQHFLSQFTIGRASIVGIGTGRKALLASYGIDTAADVTPTSVRRVPGFGEAKTDVMVAWRRGLEHRFVFSPQPTPTDIHASEQLSREHKAVASKLRAELHSGAAEMQRAATTIQARLQAEDPAVTKAFCEWRQTIADLEFLGMPRPKPSTLTQTKTPVMAAGGQAPQWPTSAARPLCPKCKGSMVRRRNRRMGNYFWGCSAYPRCRGTRSS